MAKRPKINPMEQGSAPELLRIFFAPLIKLKPERMDLNDWLELLFHTKERDILRYRVHTPFELQGLYLAAANVAIQGIGYRDVGKDAILYIRTDTRYPDTNHVEFYGGQGGAEQVFLLDQIQLNRTLVHCSEDRTEK